MSKQIEDYPELDEWFDDNADPACQFNGFEYVVHGTKVNEKLLELAQQLEQTNERVKELEKLQSKYVWITREEMKEYSDINQALMGESLAQHDNKVRAEGVRVFANYLKSSGFTGVDSIVEELIRAEQLKEGDQ